MATKRQEIIDRAKEILAANPYFGKERVNQFLRVEFGVGLRSSKILSLKREVGEEKPELYADLYERGSVGGGLNDIYRGWIKAGFLPAEARELTIGSGVSYRNFDARAVYDSEPGKAAREFRANLVSQQLSMGWSKKQIIDNILDFYRRIKKFDPWEHIRAEYKPRKKVDYIEGRRKRAIRRQRDIMKARRRK